MWGIYHRVLALLSAAASSMRGKQHRQMAGEVEAEEGSTHWKAVTAGWAPGAEKGSRAGRKRACRGEV